MNESGSPSLGNVADAERWSAVAEWYHAFFTGLVMTTATRQSNREAADLVFRIFRRQHHERFLPGIAKLGLANLPPAVTAARYHYLSNAIGGVRVEYMEESPRKAWVRYAPPRWAWQGTAICAIPGEVSRAMLHGWHGHNGVTLGNKRLGFVCTKQTMDGQPGLEGYYCEFDHDLEPEDRIQFARGEEAPLFDPAKAPELPTSTWPRERLQKARRNYAMEYTRTAIPELIALFGPAEATYLGGITARLIGMQFYNETAKRMGLASASEAESFARFMLALARAQGDDAEIVEEADGPVVRQASWKLMSGLAPQHATVFEIWNGMLDGACAAHNRFLQLKVERRLDQGDGAFVWRVVPRPRQVGV